MKVFVASSFLNKPAARKVMRALKTKGHTITFDWTQPEHIRTDSQRTNKALADVQGVIDADILVVVWPGRYGTMTEIGIALGTGKLVAILGSPDVESIYWYHPRVYFYSTLPELLEACS